MADMEYIVVKKSLFFILLSLVSCLGQDLKETCASELKGCYCTDEYIDCQGAEFTNIRDIYPYITNNTDRISITGGQLQMIPDKMFNSSTISGSLHKVGFLNLSGNNIETVGQQAFELLPNLQILDLSFNDISVNLCYTRNNFSTALAQVVKIEELYLSHVFRKTVAASCDLGNIFPGNIFPKAELTRLKKLDLSSNNFDLDDTRLDLYLCNTFTIESLNLSRNNFDMFPVSQCMTNLKVLDLSYNQITILSAVEMDIIEALVNLEYLSLGSNPFQCDCNSGDTLHWLNSTNVPLDFENIVCGEETVDVKLVGKPMKGMQFTDICEEPRIIVCYGPSVLLGKTSFVAILAGAAVLVLSVITVVVFLCRRRRRHQRQQYTNANAQMISDEDKTPGYRRMV